MMRVFTFLSRQLKSWYDAVRNLPDRMQHRSRHAAVRHRLALMGRPQTLLVVCSGNICRSPYLEAVLKRDLPDIRITSGGLMGFDQPVPPQALAASAKRRIDLSAFRSATLEPQRARAADLVIVMEKDQARYLATYMGVAPGRIIIAGDLDPFTSPTRAIQDPWKQSLDVFESSFERLDRCAATLTQLLRPRLGRGVTVSITPTTSPTAPRRSTSGENLSHPSI